MNEDFVRLTINDVSDFLIDEIGVYGAIIGILIFVVVFRLSVFYFRIKGVKTYVKDKGLTAEQVLVSQVNVTDRIRGSGKTYVMHFAEKSLTVKVISMGVFDLLTKQRAEYHVAFSDIIMFQEGVLANSILFQSQVSGGSKITINRAFWEFVPFNTFGSFSTQTNEKTSGYKTDSTNYVEDFCAKKMIPYERSSRLGVARRLNGEIPNWLLMVVAIPALAFCSFIGYKLIEAYF